MPSSVPITVVGQQRGELVHDVELVAPVEAVEQRARPLAARSGSSSAMRRGVKRRAISLRIAVCSGGSISIIDFVDGAGVLDRHPAGRRVRAGIVQTVEHVVEARQGPEVHALVVVQRHVVAQPPVRGVRVAVEVVVERIELHRGPSRRSPTADQTRLAAISASPVSWVLSS